MFSPIFERVYREAFTSATGQDFDSPEVQAAHDEYVPPVEEALIDHWTYQYDDFSEAIIDGLPARKGESFRIRHPNTAEFDENDAANIAHIRFLGHSIIATAMKFAPIPTEENQNDRGLSYIRWHELHVQGGIDQERSFDPDCASPLRLENWPETPEYVNCLGISIGVAAQEQRDRPEEPFFYINRLRHARYESDIRFTQALNMLRAMEPAVIDYCMPVFVVSARYSIPDSEEVQKEYLAVPWNIGEIAADPNFHHSVLTQGEGFISKWAQIDPYGGFVGADLSPYSNKVEDLLEYSDVGTCNEVVVHDSDVIEYGYDGATAVLRLLKEMSQGLMEAARGNYKSTKYMEAVYEKYHELHRAIFYSNMILRNHDQNPYSVKELMDLSNKYGLETDEESDAYWLMELLMLEAEINPDGSELSREIESLVFDKNERLRWGYKKENENIKTSIDKLQALLGDEIQYNSQLRDNFIDSMEKTPYVFGFEIIHRQVTRMTAGSSDQALEIADPEFMIGAMYLNHYATWRKDGTVNVAKELARLTPSQLIWQAAVAREPDAINDDRVRSVGKLLTSLKTEQLHPLVRIALPFVKE